MTDTPARHLVWTVPRWQEIFDGFRVECSHVSGMSGTPATLRMKSSLFPDYAGSAFKAFAAGEAVVDPTTPDRLGRALALLTPTDTVMISTLTDAWSPEALAINRGGGSIVAT